MFNKNSFSGLVYVVKDLVQATDNFGYAFVVNSGKDRDSGLFMKVIMNDAVFKRAQSGFFEKGRDVFVTGVLENQVYEGKNTLVLKLLDFAAVSLSKNVGNGNKQKETADTVSADGVPF